MAKNMTPSERREAILNVLCKRRQDTIANFVPNYLVSNYQEEMDKIFGKGSCEVLKIRKYGGIKVL